ncbi:hypothetical protein V2S66_00635 [Streptomyces sp. V4-01]|uniref:Uncharacterized protein n=1 Tax=Actinacidiphila polyblastidii TaxID=3110430 RepID=A0ABU7P3U0_9ACTN|nr:hypothetical protein [Streptomyces sp. V4-01]
MHDEPTTRGRGRLGPVAHRGRWIAGGLGLQLGGIGGPLAYVAAKAKHEDITGLISLATVRLAWHESLHARAGIAVLAAGAVVFALGSVLLARPFAERRLTLLVAVPVAAVCGAFVLGVAALLVALLILLSDYGGDIPSGGGGSSGKKAGPKTPRTDAPDPSVPSGGFGSAAS